MYLYILVTYQVLRESSKCLATNGMISFTVENYETNEDSAGFEVLSWTTVFFVNKVEKV